MFIACLNMEDSVSKKFLLITQTSKLLGPIGLRVHCAYLQNDEDSVTVSKQFLLITQTSGALDWEFIVHIFRMTRAY